MTQDKKYLSTTELAKLLGVSRVSVFNKIKSGEIQAERIGRNYAIPIENLREITKVTLSVQEGREVEEAVERVVREYGVTLRLLGRE